VPRPNWRNLPAVDPVDVPSRLSVTFLRHANACARSAYLYLKHGSAPAHELDRGTALHLWAEQVPWLLIQHDEPHLETDVGRDLMDKVLDDHPELGVTVEDAVHLRQMAYHLAGDARGRAGEIKPDGRPYPVGYAWRPGEVVAVERTFVLEVEGWRIVGKVDLAHLGEDRVLDVEDFKSSLHVPTLAEYDGSLQTKLYGALILFGQPATQSICAGCHGETLLRCQNCGNKDAMPGSPRIASGSILACDCSAECIGRGTLTDHEVLRCGECGDRGYTETLEPNVGEYVQWVRTSEVFPRYLSRDGTVATRSILYSRQEIHEFMGDLVRLVRRVEKAFDDWRWGAIRGTHCSICPAQSECPLPEVLRPHAGKINDLDRASEALEWCDSTADRIRATRAEVRAFARAREVTVPVGRDEEYVFELSESRKTDWDALEDGVERARRYGEPFALSQYVKPQKSTSFVKRKREVTADV
jgi:hypothetical protein